MKMKFVFFVLGYVVAVAVCDPSWMANKMRYYDKEHEHEEHIKSGKGDEAEKNNDFSSNFGNDDDMVHSSVDKDNNQFRSNVDLEQFMTKRGKDDFDGHGVPPFDDDDDRMKAFTLNDEELTKRSADGKSFTLNDEELSRRGANGKPVSFKMSNKGNGKGFREELDGDEGDDDGRDFPSDDFDMPGDMGNHDFSSFPFTDHGSPFKDHGFPFNDHSFDDDDESMGMDDDEFSKYGASHANDDFFEGRDDLGKSNDDSASQKNNAEDRDDLHGRLRDSFTRRQREHEEYLAERDEMMSDADYSLGIDRKSKDKKRKEKKEEKEEEQEKKNADSRQSNDVEDIKEYENELLKERTMTTEKRGSEETHCWDVVVSMTCKRVELVEHPYSKRVCDNRKIEKRCTKVENKKE